MLRSRIRSGVTWAPRIRVIPGFSGMFAKLPLAAPYMTIRPPGARRVAAWRAISPPTPSKTTSTSGMRVAQSGSV